MYSIFYIKGNNHCCMILFLHNLGDEYTTLYRCSHIARVEEPPPPTAKDGAGRRATNPIPPLRYNLLHRSSLNMNYDHY